MMLNPYPLFQGNEEAIGIGSGVTFLRLNFIDDKNLVFLMFVYIDTFMISTLSAPINSRIPCSSMY